MADNYLEKRYEEVFGKGAKRTVPAIHRSLDSLLGQSCSDFKMNAEWPVNAKQLELIAAAAERVCGKALFEIRISPSPAQIAIFPQQENAGNAMLDAGRAIQAMILKSFDLGLAAELQEGAPGGPLAVIRVGKAE